MTVLLAAHFSHGNAAGPSPSGQMAHTSQPLRNQEHSVYILQLGVPRKHTKNPYSVSIPQRRLFQEFTSSNN